MFWHDIKASKKEGDSVLTKLDGVSDVLVFLGGGSGGFKSLAWSRMRGAPFPTPWVDRLLRSGAGFFDEEPPLTALMTFMAVLFLSSSCFASSFSFFFLAKFFAWSFSALRFFSRFSSSFSYGYHTYRMKYCLKTTKNVKIVYRNIYSIAN